MKLSKLIGKRLKEVPREATSVSHQFLLRGGYVRPVASGIYSLLPLAKTIIAKIEAIIRQEMDAIGGQEVLMPVVMPRDLWEESGRYQTIDQAMVRFKDRNAKDFVLGMTHEEAVLALARTEVSSYKQLPFILYQIQTKFRDEPRPRGGLIRVREFTMKDAYSFHRTQEDLARFYGDCYKAYERIFARVGLKNTLVVESDTGMMGGAVAHEFMLETAIGEDSLVLCDQCGYAANSEVASARSKKDNRQVGDGDQCLHCGGNLRITRGIEIGNIFQLGTKYTASMGMSYLDEKGRGQIPLMGCYGIGVGRLMASVIEDCHDARGPIWPKSIAPYHVHLCVLDANDQAVAKRAEEVYEKLQRRGIDVLWDDSNAPVGVQFADADLIGLPVRLVISKRTEQRGVVEYAMRDGSFRGDLSINDVIAFVTSAIYDG